MTDILTSLSEHLTGEEHQEGGHHVEPTGGNEVHHGGHDGEGAHHGGHHSDQPLIILFVFVGLLIGGALRELNKKTKFPYTPMLIIVGIIMGNWRDSLGVVGQSTTILSHINPHMLLFIFIPVLIFESGFNCDWYIFKRALFNIILLAGPGVLWGAILLACCLKWVCGYSDDEVSWAGALTMGSIMSATDPVAVVALLKELGASIRFGHLIEGESLLNDGVAMVFYQVFVELAKPTGAAPSIGGITVNLVRIAGGGPILGFLMGLIGSLWLRRVIRDDVLTSTITFIACYIVFYFAEFTFFHVSGILAIVVLGLFMSAFGKTKIYPESEHAVHTVWSFAQYGCETIIFLLTGVLIGVEMMDKSTITSADWVKMFVFYLCMIVMRFVMVGTFWKLLQSHGYGLSKAEFWVLIWGGLRGALGLTLALMVGVDQELPQRLRELTVFFMSGTATLTLLINGTTCSSLVKYLGMVEDPQIRKKILNNTMKKLVNATAQKQEELKSNKYLNLTNWDLVEEMTGIQSINSTIDELDKKQIAGGSNRNSLELSGGAQRGTVYGGLDQKEVHSESRLRILRLLKGLFWERYDEGQVGGEATRMLEEACNICLDSTRDELNVWENVYINFTNKKTLGYFFKMKEWPLIGGICKGYITAHLAFIYEVSTTFVICVKEALEIQHDFPIKNTWIQQILDELNNELIQAEKFISDMSEEYQTIIKAIHSKRAAISVLEYHKKFISEYKHKGYLDDASYEELRKDIDRKIVDVENRVFEWELPNFHRFVIEFPVFSALRPEQQKILQHQAKEKTFPAGNYIFEQGQEVDCFYIIMRGTVQEEIQGQGDNQFSTKLGVGSFLNFGNAALQNGQAISSCKAVTNVTLNEISFQTILNIMEQEPKFEEKVYKGSVIYLVQSFFNQSGPLGKLSEDKLQQYVQAGSFEKFDGQQTIKLEDGGYLITGELQASQHVQEIGQDETIVPSHTYLEPNVEYTPNNGKLCLVVRFDEKIENRDSIRNIVTQDEEIQTQKQYATQRVKEGGAYIAPGQDQA